MKIEPNNTGELSKSRFEEHSDYDIQFKNKSKIDALSIGKDDPKYT